jgi:hypothetical protein
MTNKSQTAIASGLDCWICGAPATTGEHKTKQSDLRGVLGKPTQEQPFYYHDKKVRNRPIGSYKGDFLKSTTSEPNRTTLLGSECQTGSG